MRKGQRERGQQIALQRLQKMPLGALDLISRRYERGELVESRPYETRIALPPHVERFRELAILQKEWTRVGDDARREIRAALAQTGIPPSAQWGYLVYHHTLIRGEGHVVGRAHLPAPGLPLPLGQSGPWTLAREVVFRWPWDKRYQGYRFEVFGLQLESGEAIEQQPSRTAWIMSQPAPIPGVSRFYALATYRVRITHDTSPVIATTHWQPGWDEPKPSYEGGSLGDDPSIATRGLELYYGFTRSGPTAMSDEEAFEEAVQFGLEWLHDNPNAEPADFGRKQFTAKRCTGHEATEKWMKEKHFGIRKVQRELGRRFQRPN